MFERLPIEPDELIKYYHLTADELAIISKRRRGSNRLGFAVQLCLCRYPGRTLRTGEHLPEAFLTFIAEQTNTRVEDFADYAHRDQTRRAHIAELLSTFGFWTFTVEHFRKMRQWLVPIAVETPKSMFLVGAVFNELRHRRIL
jgi:TnpA family transposase